MMRAEPRRLPFKIGTDKHASYPEAFASSVKEKVLPPDYEPRRVRYLNNVTEQDHRFNRRRRRAIQCFRSFHTDRLRPPGSRRPDGKIFRCCAGAEITSILSCGSRMRRPMPGVMLLR